MPINPIVLASLILKAIDTGVNVANAIQKALNEAKRAPNPEQYIQQVVYQINVYPGDDYDDDREEAIELLLEEWEEFE